MNDAAMSQSQLIDAVTDHAIFMLDAGGVVQSWSKGAERLKGYRAGDIVGRHFSAFYTDEDRRSGLPDRVLAVSERDGSFNGEGWRIRQDGSRFWADVAIDPIHDPAGKLIGFAKVTRDLTERKRAADALRESEEQFRLLVEAVADHAIYRLDLQGRITSWNKGAQVLIGYRSHEIVGRHFSEFYTKDDREREEPERGLGIALRQGRFESQGWRVRQDGSTFWADVVIHPILDDQDTAIGFAKVTRDITARTRLETELNQSRAHLDLAVANMADGLVLYDADATIRFCNQQYRDLFPKTADLRVVGTNFRDIARAAVSRGEEKPGEDVEAWIENRLMTMRRAGERLIELSDGRQIVVRSRATSQGGMLLTFHDISELTLRETELREATRLLLMAEEIAHVGHWRLELPSRVLTWSAEVYRIHGLDPKSFRPDVETAMNFYHPDDQSEVKRCVAEALSRHRSFEFNLRIIHTDGDVRYVQSRGRCEIDEATGRLRSLFGVVLDVTEQAKTERRLTEKSMLLQATLDNMEQGIVKVAADRRIELWNRRFSELLDVPQDIFMAEQPHFDEVMQFLDNRGEFDFAARELRQRALDRGKPLVVGTHERLRPNGQILEVVTSPLSDGSVVSIYSNITARRVAERALQDSEARYRMLADTTSDVITQLDLDLVRRYVSPACRATLGYEPEEMIGMTPSVLIHPDDASQVRTVMELLAAGAVPGDKSTVTNRMRHKEGHWVWLEAGINLVRDPDSGAPQSLICSLRDVTERQRAARHLERAKAIAENAARIKADFVANMSHELRTPLTGILGVHDLLKADPDLNARHRRYLDMAYQAGRSLLSIVNDVLDFSKIEAGQLSIERIPFDLDEMVAACRDFASAEARKKSLEIDLHLTVRGIKLVGDPNRLRQIMLNLLMNAVKFTQQGGVTLDVRYDTSAARLRVEVSDTGIGIAEDKIPLLFGRFSQADASITRRYGGTGLGLAICKRLIELMGGDIGVTSEPGLGTTVWFELPLSPSPSGPQERPDPDSYPAQPARRVLLAEDNLVNQEMIVAMIESRGHKVTAVDDGVAAVEAAQADAFDIILMDMQMPVLDGLSAAHAIRGVEKAQGRPAIPIIGLTANALADDIKRCREAGMDAHVAKPIEWTELFTTMDRLTLKQSGEIIAAVLEPEKLTDLARYIGRERLNRMLERFVVEVEQRLNALGSSTVAELATTMHILTSMAGQFGFMEFSNLCAEIDAEARQGAGLNRLPDLAAAGERAVAAAKSSIAAE